MNINLGDYKLTSDKNNIIIHHRYFSDPTKSPMYKEGDPTDLKETWKDIAYCSNLEQAINFIFNHNLRVSDADTLQAIIEKIHDFESEVKALLTKN